MKRWIQIFKALGSSSRMGIIKLLSDGKERTVTEVAIAIHVTLPATSKHLIQLHNLDVLKNVGKAGHVFYSLNDKLPADIKKTVDLFLK